MRSFAKMMNRILNVSTFGKNDATFGKNEATFGKNAKLKSLTPKTIAAPFGRYAHGTRISGFTNLVQTSGQLGVAMDGSIPAAVKEQAEICFANIDAILAEGGMRREDIFHITAFVTDRQYMAEYMAARDAYLADVTELPASTLLIVTGFTRPEFKVEIQVTAAR